MVRVRGVALVVTCLALAGSRPALADPLTLTGNVANDFPQSIQGVNVTRVGAGPGTIAGPSGNTPNTLVAGWDIQDIRTYYNAASDVMYVGIQGYKNVAGQEQIFGDSTGNPNASLDPSPNLGGDKSVAIQFAPISVSTSGQAAAG